MNFPGFHSRECRICPRSSPPAPQNHINFGEVISNFPTLLPAPFEGGGTGLEIRITSQFGPPPRQAAGEAKPIKKSKIGLPLRPEMELITLKEYDNCGKIRQYRSVDTTAGDYPKVFACCDYFARSGATAIITPAFLVGTIGNPEYEEIYSSLKGSPYWGKCPDFCVNGIWYEHEGYNEAKDMSKPNKRADTFSKMLNRGLKQSDRLIIEECGVGHSYARRSIFRRIRFEGQSISEIYIRTQSGLDLFYKKEAE